MAFKTQSECRRVSGAGALRAISSTQLLIKPHSLLAALPQVLFNIGLENQGLRKMLFLLFIPNFKVEFRLGKIPPYVLWKQRVVTKMEGRAGLFFVIFSRNKHRVNENGMHKLYLKHFCLFLPNSA